MNEFGIEKPELLNRFNRDNPIMPEGFPLPDNSVLRRISAEPVGALLVQRAVLLEVAHPVVAEGVSRHSAVQKYPIQRLITVLNATMDLVGSQDESSAIKAARKIHNIHDHVQGRGYSAHMGEAQMWVAATMVDLSETVQDRYIANMSREERESNYQDIATFCRFFGIPEELIPADRERFQTYFDGILSCGSLGKTEASRKMMNMVLRYKHWQVPAFLVAQLRALTLVTLPPEVLDQLELRPTELEERLGRLIDESLKRYYGKVPESRRKITELFVTIRNTKLGGAIVDRLVAHPIR